MLSRYENDQRLSTPLTQRLTTFFSKGQSLLCLRLRTFTLQPTEKCSYHQTEIPHCEFSDLQGRELFPATDLMSPCSLDQHGSNSHLTSSGQSGTSPATSYLLGLTSHPWAPRCAPDPQHGPLCAAEWLVGCQKQSCRQFTRNN